MNTNREIIGEVEQMAVTAIVHQPDGREAAERHFSAYAKKIVEKAMQAVDIMEIGDVCRRAMTGAAIQDYDLLANLLTDKGFDHGRLLKAIEALASERPVDFPVFYTPGWIAELAKKNKNPTEAEIHEAATEEPVGCPSLAPANLPSGADGTPSEEEDREAQSARDSEIAYKARLIKWQKFETKKDICVMGRTKQNGKVYEIRIEKRENPDEKTTFYCSVNGTEVLHGDFLGGAHMVKAMLEKAMQALVNRKAGRNRAARLRKAKRSAAAKSGEVK